MRRCRLLALFLLLLTAGVAPMCGDLAGSPFRIGLPDAAGLVAVEIRLPPGTDPAEAEVRLDLADVTSSFAPGGEGLLGTLPEAAPGPHSISVSYPAAGGLLRTHRFDRFDSPTAAPALLEVSPDLGGLLPHTAWLRLRFDGPVQRAAMEGWGFGIECDGERVPRDAVRADGTQTASGPGAPDSVVIVNPRPSLPASPIEPSCRVAWRGPGGSPEERTFQVAGGGGGDLATVLYDRTDLFQLAPFPDDYWLVDDPSTGTGRRVALEVAPYAGFPLNATADGIAASLADRDGFSPIQPVVIQLSRLLRSTQLPADEFASQDPFSPLVLVDVDPASPEFGELVPFSARTRSDPFFRDGTTDHTLTLFPARVLRDAGRYAVVLSRRLLSFEGPRFPFQPSAFFAAAMAPPQPGEAPEVARARASIEPVLGILERDLAVPIPREDVALVLPFSTRSLSHDPSDWVAVAEDYLAGPPLPLDITSVQPSADGSTAFRGTLELPFYLLDSLHRVNRDPATGRPIPNGTEAVPFVLQLPPEAAEGPVPIVIYSHGSPGSPEEIFFNDFLREAGYALIGIQDVSNRRFGESSDAITTNTLGSVIANQALPLAEKQTHFDHLGLQRAIDWLAGQSLLPVGAPDAVPEVDASRILYRGISQGAHNSLGVLPFSPRITAAVSVVGGGRAFENTIHQVDFFGLLGNIQGLIQDASPALILTGLAALQNDADRYDPHFRARHLYREPLAVEGQTDDTPPSLLWIEGIGDNIVSNTGTRSAARELGIPQVGNVRAPTPILSRVEAPLAGNLAPGLTAGHYQYLPAETPSCGLFAEGHFCPQGGPEVDGQILHFFATALEGEAEILDPLP